MDRIEKAALLKRSNNCCQAVLLSYADVLELSEEQLTRLGKTFGAGMGGMQATCGALVGAIMIASLRASGGSQSPATATGEAMKLSRQIFTRFKELCGATICGELKGVGTGKVLCSCENCVRKAIKAGQEALV